MIWMGSLVGLWITNGVDGGLNSYECFLVIKAMVVLTTTPHCKMCAQLAQSCYVTVRQGKAYLYSTFHETSNSRRSGMDHTGLPLQTTPYHTLRTFARRRHLNGRHLIPACYSFIDPGRMKGWVGLLTVLTASLKTDLTVTDTAQQPFRYHAKWCWRE